MKKEVDVGQIKGTSITADWQQLAAQSMVGSITDDSLGAILTTCEKVSNCDDKLVRGLTNLNSYMNSMAEAFQEMDESVAKMVESGTDGMSSSIKGPNSYRAMF